MSQAEKTNLHELQKSIYEAQKATKAMLTFTTLLGLAAALTDGSGQREKLPDLVDISEFCDELALRAEDAVCAVQFEFEKHERSLNQWK